MEADRKNMEKKIESLSNLIDINREVLEKIKDTIDQVKKIAIIGHSNPDGDCIGSSIALSLALKEYDDKYDITMICEKPFSVVYKEYEKIFEGEITEDFELFIILDSAGLNRVGALSEKIDLSKTIVIDHHATNAGFGILSWVDDIFLSASEMVFLLIDYIKRDFNNREIYQNLLNGVLADNGYFSHIRADKYLSLLISYEIIARGANPLITYTTMFNNNSIATEKLLAITLSRLTPIYEEKVLYSYIYNSERADFGNPIFESGMLFKEMMSIKSTVVAIFFKINEEENKINISFRSREDKTDVSKIAALFGGGGHKVAAATTVNGTFEIIKEQVLREVEKIL